MHIIKTRRTSHELRLHQHSSLRLETRNAPIVVLLTQNGLALISASRFAFNAPAFIVHSAFTFRKWALPNWLSNYPIGYIYNIWYILAFCVFFFGVGPLIEARHVGGWHAENYGTSGQRCGEQGTYIIKCLWSCPLDINEFILRYGMSLIY